MSRTDFEKGWVLCLIEQVRNGGKKIAEYEGALHWSGGWKQALEFIRTNAKKSGIHVAVETGFEQIELKHGKIQILEFKDGRFRKRTITKPGIHRYQTASIILYKDVKDYRKFLRLKDSKDSRERHVSLGKLFGYGKEEIADFLLRRH